MFLLWGYFMYNLGKNPPSRVVVGGGYVLHYTIKWRDVLSGSLGTRVGITKPQPIATATHRHQWQRRENKATNFRFLGEKVHTSISCVAQYIVYLPLIITTSISSKSSIYRRPWTGSAKLEAKSHHLELSSFLILHNATGSLNPFYSWINK